MKSRYLTILALLSAVAGCSGTTAPRQVKRQSEPRASGVTVSYEGTLRYFGHYRRPGEAKEYPIKAVWARDGDRVRYDAVLYDPQGAVLEAETTIVVGPDVWHQTGHEWNRVIGCQADWLRHQAQQGLPEVFAEAEGSEVVRGETIDAIELSLAHARLGDVRHRVSYRDYERQDGLVVPLHLEVRQFEPEEPNELDLTLTSARASAEAITPPRDAPVRPSQPCVDSPPVPPRLSFVQLDDGLWSIEIDTTDSRVLVLEGSEALTVMEAPVSSFVGEAIIGALATRFPNKPVTTLLVGHHHPHYAGAARAFAAAGAKIVTTPQTSSLIRSLLTRAFTLRPDALAQRPRDASLEVFEGRWRSPDGRIEAIDIGSASDHTDEYIVFYVPGAELLFQGDLGWFTRAGTTAVSSRTRGLLRALRDHGVTPTRFVQSWPVAGNPSELSRSELEALLEKAENE